MLLATRLDWASQSKTWQLKVNHKCRKMSCVTHGLMISYTLYIVYALHSIVVDRCMIRPSCIANNVATRCIAGCREAAAPRAAVPREQWSYNNARVIDRLPRARLVYTFVRAWRDVLPHFTLLRLRAFIINYVNFLARYEITLIRNLESTTLSLFR